MLPNRRATGLQGAPPDAMTQLQAMDDALGRILEIDGADRADHEPAADGLLR